ncbi:MAG: TolC family protein [Moraxellaceae bacterium]
MSAPQTASLRRYIDAVLDAHPDMKASDANVMAAEARAESLDRPIYNPELVLDGQQAQSDSYSAGLNQTVDMSGKRQARRLSGQKQLEQAVADRDALRQQLASDIVAALADYYGKQAALALTKQRLDVLERFSSITERQYQAGDIGLLERNLGSLALTEAIALSGRAELEQLQAHRELVAITRNPLLEPPSLPMMLPLPAALPANLDGLAQALPSVRAAAARSETSLAEVEVARSNSHADPTFGIRGGRESSDSEATKSLIGLQVSIPLFVRNNYRAEEKAASAAADAARYEAAALYQQSLAQMQASARQYSASYAAWERWRSASGTRMEDGIELLDKVWKVREISTSDYLVQLKQLLDGRAAGEELKYQTWRAWAEWLASSGQWSAWLTPSTSSARTPLPLSSEH